MGMLRVRSRCLMRPAVSKPSRPSICTSRRMTAKSSPSSCRSACSPEWALTSRTASGARMASRARRLAGLSSTSRTLASEPSRAERGRWLSSASSQRGAGASCRPPARWGRRRRPAVPASRLHASTPLESSVQPFLSEETLQHARPTLCAGSLRVPVNPLGMQRDSPGVLLSEGQQAAGPGTGEQRKFPTQPSSGRARTLREWTAAPRRRQAPSWRGWGRSSGRRNPARRG